MVTPDAALVAGRPIPRLRERPFLGSALALRREPLAVYQRVVRECGDIGLLHFGPFPIVFLNSPELIGAWLVERAGDFDKGEPQRRAFRPWVGQGLLSSEGELHRTQRKLLAPSFTPRRVAGYAATIVDYAERNQAAWADGAEIGLSREMTGLTMSIVSKALLDTEVSGEDRLGAAITEGMRHINYLFNHPFPLPLWVPTPRNRRTRRAMALLQRHVRGMIAARRADAADRGDVLSLLLQARDEAGQGMSDRQVYDEAVTLFVAGHETTANALTWAFWLLARHPECYDRLQREVDAVLAGRPPTAADLPRLPYALQVFKEAMRLYPPSSGLMRIALRDTEIGGYPIRRRTTVLSSQYVLHRRPDTFPEPERFDPERFAPERERELPRYAYLPFGAGHRVCIGNHFALLEGHLLVATLAQRVRFELASGQDVAPQLLVTLRPAREIAVRVRRVRSG